MSDKVKREWKFYIEDMIKFSNNVLLYTDGFELHSFVESGINYDATLRNLELIGESATHIPDEIRVYYPDIL